MMHITDDIGIEEREVEERFVRSMGPGGQNARKEATSVELRLDLGASTLPRDIKDRLRAIAGRAVTAKGTLVVMSRALRSQADNRAAARERLIALLRRAATPPKKRRPTRPGKAIREQRLESKRARGSVKQLRSHPTPGED